MYQALYRKYRPSTFDEVVGQEAVVRTLKNAIINNKLTHAYLFAGPRGTGKTSIAKILAKTVNCLDLKDATPCNKCVNCTQINNKQTTDIVEIDAASNNGVDEIREIRSKVTLVPSNSKYKVYIIDEVHMLSTGAFNALLKTLEEPPSHVIFILATTDPHKIPLTILSRCQRFDFKKIENDKIVKKLKEIATKENVEADDDALLEIAKISDGGMRDAISIFDQAISYNEGKVSLDSIHEINGTISKKELTEFLKYLLDKDLLNLLNKLDYYNNNGKNLVKIAEEIVLFLRDVLLSEIVPEYFKNNNIENYKDLIQNTDKEYLLEVINKFNLSINDMKMVNDPKLVLELLLIKLTNIKIDKTETTHVEKNEQLQTISDNFEKVSIKKEEKKEKLISNNYQYHDMTNVIDIRVNNSLATFQKTLLKPLKEKIENVSSKLLVPEYSSCASLILDGELKVTSEDYLLFVYKSSHLADIFNQSIIKIEKIIKDVCEKEYKVIAIDMEKWEIIKQEFNSKSKKYELLEENFDLNEIFKDQKEEDIESLFGNIIEYKEEI